LWWFSSVQQTRRYNAMKAFFHKYHQLMRRYVFWFQCRNLWAK
jgi:hypothetical protein